ncbi:hypothetical protein EMCG_01055 [[Emmonsia] crescens]|uniref:Uncharacterized protein n=1 Tax=[Emmonsia] crescens TaxID=73230 RepID=A0A0G2J791_9EURO|nr:hypothetical protein EMCG_01055 [Emmonsia crescens UAMH 3008]
MAASESAVFPFLPTDFEVKREEAWNESKPVVNSLPKPRRGVVTAFLPTYACYILIQAVINNYPQMATSSTAHQLKTISKYRPGGLVFLPGKADIGNTFTIVIPLYVSGMVKVGGQVVDTDHIYHILSECFVEIPDDGKLAALVMDEIV